MLPARAELCKSALTLQVLLIIWEKGGCRVWAALSTVSRRFAALMHEQLRKARKVEPRMEKLMLDLRCVLLRLC